MDIYHEHIKNIIKQGLLPNKENKTIIQTTLTKSQNKAKKPKIKSSKSNLDKKKNL